MHIDPDGLRRELAMRGMTQAELAAAAGVSEATVSHAMVGRQVDYRTLRKFARALTVTPVLPGADAILAHRLATSPTHEESDSRGRTSAS